MTLVVLKARQQDIGRRKFCSRIRENSDCDIHTIESSRVRVPDNNNVPYMALIQQRLQRAPHTVSGYEHNLCAAGDLNEIRL